MLLSYDIIKAHGGGLKVETMGVEGAEFYYRITSNYVAKHLNSVYHIKSWYIMVQKIYVLLRE
ncbi:MAG: hypothetical protein WKF91_19275 [Segetibacter sp.]